MTQALTGHRCDARCEEGETHQVSFPGLRLVSVVVVPHGGLDPVHDVPGLTSSLSHNLSQTARAGRPVQSTMGQA